MKEKRNLTCVLEKRDKSKQGQNGQFFFPGRKSPTEGMKKRGPKKPNPCERRKKRQERKQQQLK